MARKRITLILLLAFGIILWISRGWWLSIIINNLPIFKENSELIQGIESAISIVGLLLNGLLALYILLTKTEKNEQPKINIELLSNKFVEDLRGLLGLGGNVNWIDRNSTNVGDLRKHGRIIIKGRTRLGKTREAIELISRAIEEDLISKDFVYKIGAGFKFLGKEDLIESIQSILNRDATILLFIDNFPSNFEVKDLEKLTIILNAIRDCKNAYVIAVARNDQLTKNHESWLEKERFYNIELPEMTNEQIGRLIDSASELFNLQVDDLGRKKLISQSKGTPELPLMALRRIKADGITQVNLEKAKYYSHESINEAWAETKRYIKDQNHPAVYILDALVHFNKANITPYNHVIIDYSDYLWRANKEININKKNKLRNALGYLTNFNIIVKDNIVIHPDEVVDEPKPNNDDAIYMVEKYFEKNYHFLRRWRYKIEGSSIVYSIVMFELAILFQRAEMFDRALRLSGYALKLNPHPSIFQIRGKVKGHQGRHKSAVEDYDNAISLDPNNALAYLSRGEAYFELGEFDNAEKDFELTLQISTDNKIKAIAQAGRGDIRRYHGDLNGALDYYDRAIKLSPNNSEILYKRGNLQYDLKNLQYAVQDFSRAIELDEGSSRKSNIFMNRGNALHELGKVDLAIEDFSKAKELDTESLIASRNLWLARESLGDMNTFSEDYKNAIDEFNSFANVDKSDSQSVIVYENIGLSLFNKLVKRAFDLLMVISSLIFVFPVMIVIGLIIKSDSPGPIFFTKRIIGLHGKFIKLYKFRTMHSEADNIISQSELEAQLKLAAKLPEDPRITPVGKILRMSSLDELPQLFNILKGDMSLIGPRIIDPIYVRLFGSDLGIILSVKPGLTGLWQLSGRSDVSFEKRALLDKYYIQNYSFILDLLILMRTVSAVFGNRRAYP